MHQSVLDAFPLKFTAPLEGYTTNPYLDEKGLRTVGLGCLIEPASSALGLGWVLPDGSLAPDTEVLAQLGRLAGMTGLRHYAAKSPTVLAATTIRLPDAAVMALANRRLLAGEPLMEAAFSKWNEWPADAQLFACSMGWAIGFGWPRIFSNCARLLKASPPGFELCAEAPPGSKPADAVAACDIKTDGNPGIIPRNAQNRLLLVNAQMVFDQKLDPSILHWPKCPLNDGTLGE